jgi:uncharacterized protein YdeI (BOF family)
MLKKGLVKLVLVIFASGLFLLPADLEAAGPTIAINEVLTHCNTGEEDYNEFIELYNYGSVPVDIINFSLTDGDASNQIKFWTTSCGMINDPDVVTNTTIVPPKSYAVVLDKQYAAFNQPYDFPPGTIIVTVQNDYLGNGLTTDDPLTLYSGLVMSQEYVISTFGTPLEYESFRDRDDDKLDNIPFDPGAGKSLERTFAEQPDSEDNWTVCGDGPSPGADNNDAPVAKISANKLSGKVPLNVHFSALESLDPEKQPLNYQWQLPDGVTIDQPEFDYLFEEEKNYQVSLTVDDGELIDTAIVELIVLPNPPFTVRLNEILPDPEESDETNEFIELYNYGDQPVSLLNYQIDDIEGGSSPYTFADYTIEPDQYFVLGRPESKITLNNDSDSVRLFDPEKNLIEEINYTDSKSNWSYNYTASGWKWSSKITKGAENEIVGEVRGDQDEYQKTTIEKAKKLADRTKVILEGIVTVEPDIFSDDYFYFQDGKAGLKVYFSQADFPKFKVGDKLRVQGEMSTAYHERKVNVKLKSDIVVIGSGEIDLETIKTNEIENEDRTGQLVTVQGKVDRNAGTVFYLDDGSGTGKVSIKETTGIKKPETKKGTAFRVTGIINKTTSGNRLLPRYQSDITDRLVGAGISLKIFLAIAFWLLTLLICLSLVFVFKQ